MTEFTTEEILAMAGILNNMECRTRGMMTWVDELAQVVELTADEKEICKLRQQQVGGRSFYAWEPGHTFAREFNNRQQQSLRQWVENPPEGAPAWNRQQLPLYNSLLEKLGGDALEHE